MQTAKITAFVFGLALVSSACGDSMSALNPTAPSSLSPDAVNVEAGANGVAGAMGNGPKPGNGNGSGNTNGNGNGNGGGQTPSLTSAPVETRVQFEGTVDEVGSGWIKVSGQVVKVTSQTVIRHGELRYDASALDAGDRVHVEGRRSESDGVVSVVADEIKLQNDGEGSETEPPPPSPSGVLSVRVVDAAAVEGTTDTATLELTRSGDSSLTDQELTVSLTWSGAATHGNDFDALTSVKFAARELTANVVVKALPDSAAEGAEAVTLTLTAPASYALGTQAAATVTINDPAAPPAPSVPTVTVAADLSTVNFDTGGVGIFVVKRNGDLSKSLTVTVSVGGSAAGAYGSFLGPLVPFDPFQETASVLFVLDGTTGDVVLTLVDGAAYNPGTPASATITVTP
jgi:Domain of unknown function (DUF5666)